MESISGSHSTNYIVTKQFIGDRTAHIGIVGLGTVGLALALRLSNSSFTVQGFDPDPEKIANLANCSSYISNISSQQIARAHAQGFRATTDFSRVAETEVVILCLSMLLNDQGEPDLQCIRETAFSLAPFLHAGQLVILEITTYPGMTEEILVPILEGANAARLRVSRNTAEANDIFVAFSPESCIPGRPIESNLNLPKVIGGVDLFSTDLAADVYATIFRQVVPVSTTAAAEMSQLLEDSYRCVNVALVNELKQHCICLNIDIWEVLRATTVRPVEVPVLCPDSGLSGHVAPRAVSLLSWKARASDFRPKFTELANEINANMPHFIVQRVVAALEKQKRKLNGSRILILGLTSERDVCDLRGSPALDIVKLLCRAGASVDYNDPFFSTGNETLQREPGVQSVPVGNVSQYDAVVILTDHSTYDYPQIVSLARLVIDTRNATSRIVSDKIVRC